MPLAAQSRLLPVPYSAPGQDDQRHAFARGTSRPRRRSPSVRRREVPGPAALGTGRQLVANADVGERAAMHDSVVAASRTVAVEVAGVDAVFDQVPARWAVLGDRTRPAKCGRLSPNRPAGTRRGHAAIGWIGCGSARQVDQERRLLDVSAVVIPRVQIAFGRLNRIPLVVRLEGAAVLLVETFRAVTQDSTTSRDFLVGGPDVSQVDVCCRRRPVRAVRWSSRCPSCRPARRPPPVAGWPDSSPAPVRIDAALEVAIAAEHGGCHESPSRDRLGDRFRQRATVADAGRATVTHGVEPQLLERSVKPALSR